MGVSIVIPTWNGLGLLQKFLPSVLAAAAHYSNHSNAPTEILIVDDGSSDATAGWLREVGFRDDIGSAARGREGEAETARPELSLVRDEENLGFGEACNRGFQLAAHPLVFLLNNDVEAGLNCIAPLVENFGDPSVFAAHCRVFEFDSGRECGTGKLGSFSRGFIRVHRGYTPTEPRGEPRALFYSMFAGGGSAMFDRQKFLEIGGFETLLSPFYWEDVELSYRAWKRGYKVLYEQRSVTRHCISSTIGKLARRKVRLIEQRNRLIYHWIHLGDARMLVSHAAWVIFLAVTAPLRLQPLFLGSLLAALRKLPAIRKRREEARRAQTRTDREVFEIFKRLESDQSVTAYDDLEELQ